MACECRPPLEELGQGGRKTRRRPGSGWGGWSTTMAALLLVLIATAALGDMVSTGQALSAGGRELNPLTALIVGRPALFLGCKAVEVALVAGVAWLLRARAVYSLVFLAAAASASLVVVHLNGWAL